MAAAASDLPELAAAIERFPATRGQGSESERLTKFFDLYHAARMREMPDVATYEGYAGVDDLLPDYSRETLALEHRLSHLELMAIDSIDRARLTPAEQLSYDLARRRFAVEIEGERFGSLDPWRNDFLLVDPMNDRLTSMLDLLAAMPAKTPHDFENMLARLRAFPRMVDQGIDRLEEGRKRGVTPPRVTLRNVPDQVLAALKQPVLEPFDHAPDARLRREAGEVFAKEVTPAIHRLHDYLVTTYIPHARETIAMSDMPDGKAWYAWLLRYYTTTALTPEQIHQLGLSEVKRIRGAMDAVIASTKFQGGFKEFSEWLRGDPRFFYDKSEDLVAGYRDIAKRIDPELPKLFGRLPRLPYGVRPMEGGGTRSAPSAYYENGSLAAGRAGWMRVNTYDLKARPKWAMESLTAHEAVPGHHLQYALVEELGALPEWRRWDVYPVFSEGWGLYAESLGGELGLYRDPYSKFGQLDNENWRAIRLVVDTGIHAMGWTRQQAIDYCRANSAKTGREIENEIDRYIVQPGSAPCYKIGALKIQELRTYAANALGAKFDVRVFHDEVLGAGQLPLDLLEERIREWVAGRGSRDAGGR